jgi:uncharacterized protein YkwD
MKKIFLLNLFIVLALTACGGSSAPATSTPATQAAPPTAAITVISPVTPTSTAPAIVPTNPSNCTDSASFVADVTVPDNTPFSQQETFSKTWRIRNIGTCVWNENYSLTFSNGEQMGAPASIPLASTTPNETIDISVDLTAPAQTGAFVANFELRNANGDAIPVDFGKYIWVSIVVGEEVAVEITPGGAVTPTASPAVSAPCAYSPNADFINQTLSLINSQRAANGLPALVVNAQLTAAAQGHAADMACNSFLSHIGSDGSSVKDRVTAAGYSASIALEDIYAQPPQFGGDPAAAVQWWMSDLIHRSALLNEKVVEIGVGYAYYADSQLDGYWSVIFAAP